MDRAKIQFSDAEQSLMLDAGVILTKNKVIAGMVQLFASLQHSLEERGKAFGLLQDYQRFSAKISKGENYLGLPYVILDYPRSFQGDHIFAIRTMFWWGNFFSMTLHIAGEEKNKFLSSIENSREQLASMDAFIAVNEDPWQHHFEKENYVPVASLSQEDFISHCRKHDHLKIACKWPLELAKIENKLANRWVEFVEIVSEPF